MADPLDLDALEKLLAAATPGEWESRPVSGHRTENEARYVCRKWDTAPWWIANVLGSGCGPFSRSEGNANADLIAALHNAAPALLAEVRALRERLAAAERERDEALAANAAAVCAWQEYGRWPEMYGVVPIGRYRGPDGVEHEIALRADQITGITRGIMRHVESLLPSGLKMVEAMQNEGALKTRAETAEALVRELAPVVKVAKAVSLRPTAALFRELEDLTLGLSPAARKEIEG